jgi:hypothetical protein
MKMRSNIYSAYSISRSEARFSGANRKMSAHCKPDHDHEWTLRHIHWTSKIISDLNQVMLDVS